MQSFIQIARERKKEREKKMDAVLPARVGRRGSRKKRWEASFPDIQMRSNTAVARVKRL